MCKISSLLGRDFVWLRNPHFGPVCFGAETLMQRRTSLTSKGAYWQMGRWAGEGQGGLVGLAPSTEHCPQNVDRTVLALKRRAGARKMGRLNLTTPNRCTLKIALSVIIGCVYWTREHWTNFGFRGRRPLTPPMNLYLFPTPVLIGSHIRARHMLPSRSCGSVSVIRPFTLLWRHRV